jgi:hypothetical protein
MKLKLWFVTPEPFRDSIVASIPACQYRQSSIDDTQLAGDQGSIPCHGGGTIVLFSLCRAKPGPPIGVHAPCGTTLASRRLPGHYYAGTPTSREVGDQGLIPCLVEELQFF